MGIELKKNLNLSDRRKIEEIIAKPVAARNAADTAFLASRADYLSGPAGSETFYEQDTDSSKVDPSLVQYVQVTLTNAELLALFTTAKQLVPAPGVNRFIEVISASVSHIYGSAAFTVGTATNLSVKYKDRTGADATSTRAVTGFCDQSSNQFSLLRPLAATLALNANVVNQPVCLALLTANMTVGTECTMKVQLVYRIHNLI